MNPPLKGLKVMNKIVIVLVSAIVLLSSEIYPVPIKERDVGGQQYVPTFGTMLVKEFR